MIVSLLVCGERNALLPGNYISLSLFYCESVRSTKIKQFVPQDS